MKRLLVAIGLLFTVDSYAVREAVVTRLGDDVVQVIDLALGRRGDCVYGNTNPPAWVVNQWVMGVEGYKYLVHPIAYESACPCEIGFKIDKMHMLMQFDAESVPVQFEAYTDLEEAVWNGECWVPGMELCTGDVKTVLVVVPGLYDIAVPIDDCACAYPDYRYFISFHILTEFPDGKLPGIITDDLPVGCTSYNDFGFGWQDAVTDLGFLGEISMQAEVSCCESPLEVESDTWGGVKAMYRTPTR